MDLKLAGKIAIVTGGSRGLGFASARALAAEGCHVAIAPVARALVASRRRIARRRPRRHRVLPIVADVATASGVKMLIETTVEQLAGIDIVVNNVGLGRGAGLSETPDDVRGRRRSIRPSFQPSVSRVKRCRL